MRAPSAVATFSDGVRQLLDRVDCRRVETARDREDVYRLRYASYLREGAITANADRFLTDRFDDAPNTWVFGVYISDRLASTIRLSVGASSDSNIPAWATFSDHLQPLFDEGRTVLDPTRFVLDESHARTYPKLPYVTLRLAWVVADHLGVDFTLASVRTEHQAFYRRFFGHSVLCPARPYPTLIKPLSLMILDCKEARPRGLRRYPFLASHEEECRALLGETLGGAKSIVDLALPTHRSDEDR